MSPTDVTTKLDYDALVVGAGTAGMETAISLGDMGFRVLLVERQPSIGGKSILLSKVFPSLDCASCIITPKMAASAHHPGVKLMTYSEVDAVKKNPDGTFSVNLHRNPTFVDPDKCTGCGDCEQVCTVAIADQYNYDLVARRAAHIPYPQAVPKKSLIDRHGSAPCTHTCPAGVSPSGYVSLVRNGKYKEAFELHMETAPLVGCLSRACYAPCEGDCTRGGKEGTVQIRAIKRFMVDRYYAEHPAPEYGPPETLLNTRVAIVGSGPSGLTAAYHLARQGHRVTVLESDAQPGGMLRFGIPAYRVPDTLLDRDILNITALGVEIKTNAPVESIQALKDQGFDAVYLAVGGQKPRIVSVTGQDLVNVNDCMTFLKTAATSDLPNIKGRHVVVIGGGNVAMDTARSAIRLGTASVTILYRRTRDKMPAHAFEVVEAEAEGVKLITEAVMDRVVTGADGQAMLEYVKVGSVEGSGSAVQMSTIPGSEQQIPADVIILAIGLTPSTELFQKELALNPDETVQVNPETLQTSMPSVFAGGDAVLGPAILVEAMGQGRRAAFYIDRLLKGEVLDTVSFDHRIPAVSKDAVLDRAKGVTPRDPLAILHTPAHKRVQSFEAYEGTFTEEEARAAANRCLDCAGCSLCRQCEKVCPAHAIDFEMEPEHAELRVGTVILSTGYHILDPKLKPLMGYGRYPNVITAPQMDRLLAPTRPFNGVLRPSDGKEPENIAMVLCTGARDHTVCNPLCCRIGCMYAAKHAQLIMGALPLAEVTIYYIDIRAFGKGYDEFFEQSKGMGVNYVKGKVAKITETGNHNLVVHYEDMAAGKGHQQAEHDMVVISVGLVPNTDAFRLFEESQLEGDALDYVKELDEIGDPARTSVDGVFAAGTVSGARDIPDTVLHAGAASAQAAAYLQRLKTTV